MKDKKPPKSGVERLKAVNKVADVRVEPGNIVHGNLDGLVGGERGASPNVGSMVRLPFTLTRGSDPESENRSRKTSVSRFTERGWNKTLYSKSFAASFHLTPLRAFVCPPLEPRRQAGE